jgi:hypothetical protein
VVEVRGSAAAGAWSSTLCVECCEPSVGRPVVRQLHLERRHWHFKQLEDPGPLGRERSPLCADVKVLVKSDDPPLERRRQPERPEVRFDRVRELWERPLVELDRLGRHVASPGVLDLAKVREPLGGVLDVLVRKEQPDRARHELGHVRQPRAVLFFRGLAERLCHHLVLAEEEAAPLPLPPDVLQACIPHVLDREEKPEAQAAIGERV